ncbi:LytTR family DNA-binding domain-containing protein [Arcobacter sp. LA11]|uniref:LytR/AlgR family response regulator transcription factor n=1 Tax=Arcobacter sp. LA11 TaxID=1898176 RepID=UPI000934E537|nr:LytTR family DNA-binding domain-containing protein [Arcobacter sp. LA11]
MKVLIVDDEKLALSRLNRILTEEGISNIVECNNPIDAIKELSKTKFDIAFLDISMPTMTGLELANTILDVNPNTFIIFQTAFEEYALEAFKSGGIDYLLKPISNESVKNALQKIEKYIQNINNDKKETSKKIIAKRGSKIYMIDIDDIYYVKADLDEVIIKIKETDAYVRKKMQDMNELLKGKNFFRIHRSYIVNVDKIKSMQSVEQSKLEISFKDIDDIVTSSKDGAKEFREYIEQRSL